MTNEIIDSLLRKIWITKKCRIVASERLEKAELYAQFIFVYYSVILVSLSIWNLFPEHSTSALSLISVIASIGLLCISLFINSRNYKNRAIALKSCYVKLGGLYSKLQILSSDILEMDVRKQSFLNIENNYLELLNNVENHSEFDYLIIATGISEINLSCIQKSKYFFYHLQSLAFKSFFLIMPLIPYFFIMKDKGV